MTTQPGTIGHTNHLTRLSPKAPWQQAGLPAVRVDAATDTIYPYLLHVGEHESVDVPMTASGLRSLRDALTAMLTTVRAAEPQDFVADWARANRAVIYTARQPTGTPSPSIA